ncbi:hypothetical protein KR054_006668 [Drosophila jambulina]|nr:hypothetical protein KR054_006668 [Drosophila jambulina]
MPLYSDTTNYYYSGGSSQLYSPYYSSGLGLNLNLGSPGSSYTSSYNRSYPASYMVPLGPSSPRSPSSYTGSSSASSSVSRYQPKLTTITESGRHSGHSSLMPLTRIQSPKYSSSSVSSPSYGSSGTTSRYIPPRPIAINTADIDVSSSRYRRGVSSARTLEREKEEKSDKEQKEQKEEKPSQSKEEVKEEITQKPEEEINQDPARTELRPNRRSTIKRNRAVVRLSTIRRRSKERPKEQVLQQEHQFRDLPPATEPSLSWRQKLAEELAAFPATSNKKSPGELLRERFYIRDEKEEQAQPVLRQKLQRSQTPEVTEAKLEKEEQEDSESSSEKQENLEEIEKTIRRLSLVQCPTFHDICEDISSDKIDDDLNAGELRRRASIIQEQEQEILNKLQKSSSGTFQLIHLERRSSHDSTTTADEAAGGERAKRRSKKSKKLRHKITAIVEVENAPQASPQIEHMPSVLELNEDSSNLQSLAAIGSSSSSTPSPSPKPKFTVNVETVEEHHQIHKVFKLPKKKTAPEEAVLPEGFMRAAPKTTKTSPLKKVSAKADPPPEQHVSVAQIFTFDEAAIQKQQQEQQQPSKPTEVKVEGGVATPKPIRKAIQKSESGEDFWSQIGSRETLYMTNRKKANTERQERLLEEEMPPATPTTPKDTKTEAKTPTTPKLKSELLIELKTATTPTEIKSSTATTTTTGKDSSKTATTPTTETPKIKTTIATSPKKKAATTDAAKTKPTTALAKKVSPKSTTVEAKSTTPSKDSPTTKLATPLRPKIIVETPPTKVFPATPETPTKVSPPTPQIKAETPTTVTTTSLQDKSKTSPTTTEIKAETVAKTSPTTSKEEKSTTPPMKTEPATKVSPTASDIKTAAPTNVPPETTTTQVKVATPTTTQAKVATPTTPLAKAATPIATQLKTATDEAKTTAAATPKTTITKTAASAAATTVAKTAAAAAAAASGGSAATAKTISGNAAATPTAAAKAKLNEAAAGPKINSGQTAKSPEQQQATAAAVSAETKINKTTHKEQQQQQQQQQHDTAATMAGQTETKTKLTEAAKSKVQSPKALKPKSAGKKKAVAVAVAATETESNVTPINADQFITLAPSSRQALQQQQQATNASSPAAAAATAAAAAAAACNATTATPTTSATSALNVAPSLGASPPALDVASAASTAALPAPDLDVAHDHDHDHDDNDNSCEREGVAAAADGGNNLSKFATVSNLAQYLRDVDAVLEDYVPSSAESSDDSYDDVSSPDYSSIDGSIHLTASMKKKQRKEKKKQKAKAAAEAKRFDPQKKIKIDTTNKCYVKEEAPRYPLVATPRPLWKREKIVYSDENTDDESGSEEGSGGSLDEDSDDESEECSESSQSSAASSHAGKDSTDGGTGTATSAITLSVTAAGATSGGVAAVGSGSGSPSIIRMSTCSNDSGFEGGTAPSSPKKMLETSYTYSQFQKSGRFTAPATVIPRFKNYSVDDFHFLAVLGKGSFGKVLLAELRDTTYYYAIKCLKKDVVLEDDDVDSTLIERKVLALGTKHPYLCHLFCTFQTESHLFFVMEYLNGGDLMFHIQESGRFSEERARFYGAEIISGLKFLHKKGIIYRDLKLDNVLLDYEGHVRIADFGMCKLQIYLDKTADSFCGTPDYMAPEIIKGEKYNQNVDWWSFGVLLYEMLIGQSPFSGCDEDELFWSICNEIPWFPVYISAEATGILRGLLEKDYTKRIGSQYSPAGDIADHIFFRPIDWGLLEKRQIEPPFKPQVKHPLDTQYFDRVFTRERVRLTPIDKEILASMDQKQFHGFTYTNPHITLD